MSPGARAFLAEYWRGAPAPRALRWREELAATDGRGCSLALLDTGLLPHHPALKGANLTYLDLTGEGGDPHQHGTRDAALLVGPGGLCPGARLLVVRVVSERGAHALAAGVRRAHAAGVDVIAMPIGGASPDREVLHALRAAARDGVQLFAAAGNRGPANHLFPARVSGVTSVTGAAPDGSAMPWCCDTRDVDLLAPGRAVPALGSTRSTHSGSSPACVLAAGVAALTLALERRPCRA